MKSFWCAIKSEVVKLRHTPIFLLHIIVPLLGGVLFAMYFHLYSGQQSITQRLNLILQATSIMLFCNLFWHSNIYAYDSGICSIYWDFYIIEDICRGCTP